MSFLTRYRFERSQKSHFGFFDSGLLKERL